MFELIEFVKLLTTRQNNALRPLHVYKQLSFISYCVAAGSFLRRIFEIFAKNRLQNMSSNS